MTTSVPTRQDELRADIPRTNVASRGGIVPITVGQYQQMIAQGIVPVDSTVELLRGVLVRKDRGGSGEDPMGHDPRHRLVVALLTALASKINTNRRHLQIQLPVVCPPDGAPEPDAAIVRGALRDYAQRLPTGADVTCAIEVADSSIQRDRQDKLPIYAGAGIPQYVLINLQNDSVEIYTLPDPAAEQYRNQETLGRGGRAPLLLPDGVLDVDVADLLP